MSADKPILVYMACPYSHPDPAVRHQRYVASCVAADELMRQGLVVFSPVSHSHAIEINRPDGKIDGGEFWLQQDFPILDRCDVLMVLCIDGWRESKGVDAEIKRWQNTRKGPCVSWIRESYGAAEIADVTRDRMVDFGSRGPEPILSEAAHVTATDRQVAYGHPTKNFASTAGMWNAYLANKPSGAPITPTDVASMMVLLKVSRQSNMPKRDNWVDIAGYARCGAQCDGFEP